MKYPKTFLQTCTKKSESTMKRKHNISWLASLSRDGLKYNETVNQLLIKRTKNDENIFIQYPGKESIRDGDKKRPWDFFPLVIKEGTALPDLSFLDIWDILYDILENLKDNKELLKILALIFYRMAYMLDHELITPGETTPMKIIHKNQDKNVSTAQLKLKEYYQYNPPKELLNELEKHIKDCAGMSIEAFLHYNDLLAWNEDCKYSYEDFISTPIEKLSIKSKGRVNTILSHITVILLITGNIKLTTALMRFSRGRGVCPATNKEVKEFLGALLY